MYNGIMFKLFTVFADSSCNGVNTNLIGCAEGEARSQ